MEENSAGSDVRALKRRHLIYYLEVYDDESGELLGHLVDITLQGLKLTSKQAIPPAKNFRLRMMLPQEFFQEKVLKFAARSMWSRRDINPDFFAVGMKAEDLDEKTAKMISGLIRRVGFND